MHITLFVGQLHLVHHGSHLVSSFYTFPLQTFLLVSCPFCAALAGTGDGYTEMKYDMPNLHLTAISSVIDSQRLTLSLSHLSISIVCTILVLLSQSNGMLGNFLIRSTLAITCTCRLSTRDHHMKKGALFYMKVTMQAFTCYFGSVYSYSVLANLLLRCLK